MSDWRVPGHELLELLGYGGAGEVWRARGAGGVVALRRLSGVSDEVTDEVRRAATVVRSLPTRHVVRVRSTVRAQGEEVLVLDHADGGSLAALLATRGTLAPGEAVTVLAPLAEALAVAHAHGVVHRRLRATEVLLTGDGMPLLDGLGLDALREPADSLDPTGALGALADVWALGALGRRLLTGADLGELPGTVPVPLAELLLDATSDDPFARPTAEELAARLLVACPALPLAGLPEPRTELPSRPYRSRALPRRALVGAAALLVLALVSGVGWTWGSRAAQATAEVAPAPTDWAAVLAGLDEARSRAFATLRPEALDAVYVPGSALRAQDEAALADLRSRGARVRGLTHSVVSVTAGAERDARVLLLVRQSLAAYVLVDARGTVLERHTAGPELGTEVVLARTAAGWRLASVRLSDQPGRARGR